MTQHGSTEHRLLLVTREFLPIFQEKQKALILGPAVSSDGSDDYKPGDLLTIVEVNSEANGYTGRRLDAKVTHVYKGVSLPAFRYMVSIQVTRKPIRIMRSAHEEE